MSGIFQSELYRFLHRKTFYIFTILIVISTLLLSLGFSAVNQEGDSMLAKSMLAAINYQSNEGPILQNADRLTLPHAVLSNLDIFLVFIVLPVISSLLIGDDRASGSLRMVLTRPISGGRLLLGKLAVLVLCNLFFIFVIFIVSQVSAFIFMPSVDSTTLVSNQSTLTAMQSLRFNLLYYLIYFAKILLISFIFSLISTCIKNTAVAVVADIAVLIAGMYLSAFLLDFLFSALTFIYDIITGHEPLLSLFYILLLSVALILTLSIRWSKMNYQD
ncbi:ABC transporter permease subunit [Paenibacillus bouchesdurhonensis]|uniref:ABC transporter permease subunit n=1 Tax=Paenibacillus bouchesdurhonensis TaxID=1870990 RepID=UPI000DA5FA23|nr:ABC transporter permease subunit [Paenibacillus bouchesdurhonensis]